MDKTETYNNLAQECEDIAKKLGEMMVQGNNKQQGEQPGKGQQLDQLNPPGNQTKTAATTTTPNQEDGQKTASEISDVTERKKKKKRKTRRNKKKKKNAKKDEADESAQQQTQKKKKSRRRKAFEDRYFGRFHCKLCKRTWESAHVFTVAGTRHVKYKQGCKNCDSPMTWYFPYAMELITCSQCQCQPCECRCETCGLLCRHRFLKDPVLGVKVVDPEFKYCRCNPSEKIWALGDNIDDKKPHLSQFCGRCLRGLYCAGRATGLGDGEGEVEAFYSMVERAREAREREREKAERESEAREREEEERVKG